MAKDKITISGWWQYEKVAFNHARKKTSKAAIGRGLFVGLLAFVGQWLAHLRSTHDTLLMVLIAIAAGTTVYLLEFLIHLCAAPAKMEQEQAAKIEEEKRLHLQTKQALEFAKNAKAEKVVEQLTELGKTLLRRISSIKGIDPVKYNPDKDDETWAAIHEAIAYIVLNLIPEAGQIFDDGIVNIHGYAIPHSGLGSTMYEDRHREVLAKLDRRFRNLKRIIDEIDKYLKPIAPVVQK